MQSKTAAGILAGLASGMGFGLFLHTQSIPMPFGPPLSMLEVLARSVGSTSPAVGWGLNLILTAAAGGIFGGVLGRGLLRPGNSIATGGAFGMVFWIVGAMIAMPWVLGLEPFSPLFSKPLRPLALALLAGCEGYGLALGGMLYALRRKAFRETPVYVGMPRTLKMYR